MLTKDKTLTDDELNDIISYDQYAQGKSLAIYYISFKMRTSSEVRKYLLDHEIEDEQIEKVLSTLRKNNIINDQNYAEQFIQGKIAMESAGPYQIKQKLSQKGVSKSTIESALEEYFPEEIQIDIATKMAEKVSRTKSNQLTLKQLKQKILQTITNKGFNYSIAQIALEQLDLKADEDNESDLLYTALDKYYRKYSRNYEGYDLKNRITQALARRGFDFDDIRCALRDYDL